MADEQPRRRRRGSSAVLKALQPPPPSPEPEISALRRYLAMGARGAGALAGFTPVSGAIGGGLGETAAQAIEGEFDPRRIVAEAAVGATGGKFVRLLGKLGGQPLKAAVQGALLGGAAPVARSVIAEGELPEARDVATSALISGATGGALSKFLGLPKVAGTVAKGPEIVRGPEMFQDVLTRGGTVAAPETGRLPYVAQGAATESPRVQKVVAKETTQAERAAKEAQKQAEQANQAAEIARVRGTLVKGTPKVSESISAKLPGGGTERMTTPFKAREAEDIQAELDALLGEPRIAEAVPAMALEAPLEVPTTPLGQLLGPVAKKARRAEKSKTEKFDQAVAKVLGQAEEAPVAAGIPTEAPIVAPIVPEVPVEAIPEVSPLMQILRTRVGATGKNYRLAREAATKGEIPTAELAREAHKREQAALKGVSATPAEIVAPSAPVGPAAAFPEDIAAAQQAADLERVTAELQAPAGAPSMAPEAIQEQLNFIERLRKVDTKAPTAAPAPITPVAAVAPEAPDVQRVANELTELERAADALETAGGDPETIARLRNAAQTRADLLAKGQPTPEIPTPPVTPSTKPRLVRGPKERGAIPVELAARLGLGLGGAAVGAATDPFDDPTLSALAGGAAGFMAPSLTQIPALMQRLGASAGDAERVISQAGTPENVKTIVQVVGRLLPQIQRANYLTSVYGLPANAVVGPFGSVLFGSLEKWLSGDPRGLSALQDLMSGSFFQEIRSSWTEALGAVGRAEGRPFSEATNLAEGWLRAPGIILTTGDITARKILQRAGFTEAEARAMTLTSEPFTKTGASGAHLRGLGWDIAFPFKRTPINIVEQGLLRTPGFGFAQQGIGAARGVRVADPLRQQVTQQGIGLGVGLGAEQIGEQLSPQDARIWSRYVTNVAGPYALLAALGLAVGRGRQTGKPALESLTTSIPRELPVPTTEPIEEWGRFISRKAAGQPADLPRGAYPSILREWLEHRERTRPAEPFAPITLPPRRRRPL